MKKYCNQWRNSYDIQNDFSAVQEHIESWAGLKTHNVPYKTFVDTNGPGSWNDPDQVLVGNGLFTPEQSRTIMSMWCLWSAPMLLSNDLRNISDWELEILLNKELIAVNQDPLGRQGYMIYNTTWNSTHTIRNNLLHADENGVLLRKPRSLTLATMRDPAQPQVDAGAAPPPPSNNAIVQVWRKDMSDDSTIALVYNTAVGRDCPISLDLQFEDFGFANITRVAVRVGGCWVKGRRPGLDLIVHPPYPPHLLTHLTSSPTNRISGSTGTWASLPRSLPSPDSIAATRLYSSFRWPTSQHATR